MTPDQKIEIAQAILNAASRDRHIHFLDACAITDAVLEVATPIIRAALYDELIAEAKSYETTVHAFGHDGPLAEYLQHRKDKRT